MTNIRIINTAIVVLLCSFISFANDIKDAHKSNEKEEFNAGKMIIDHVVDAHEWHIMTIGATHVSIPLPVILYCNEKLDFFMSSEFHHGDNSVKGYSYHHNKIIREDGAFFVDLSFTKNVLSLFLSVLFLCWIFISVAKSYKRNSGKAPKGMQSFLEPIILFIRDDVVKPSIGDKKYEKFLPFLLTLFFFIFFNNLLGLVPFFPGGANVTGNIAVTLVLAVATFIITTVVGNKNYWTHIFNAPGVPWWLKFPIPLMPIVEILGVFTKPFVLMVRLFANITAGHIIMLGFMSLIFIFGNINVYLGYGVSVFSIAFGLFMSLLEILVAFLQAYVFTLLSALYFGMAMEEHH